MAVRRHDSARKGIGGTRLGRIGRAIVHSGRHVMWASRRDKPSRVFVGRFGQSDVRRDLEEGARTHLGMSRNEFYAALDSGSLPDTPAVARLRMLAGAPRR
jgi:hypothetical protein